MLEIGLGSGIRLEVIYHDVEDRSTDNIQTATLIENGNPRVLNHDEIALLVQADIIELYSKGIPL
jgi:hypothetical protein